MALYENLNALKTKFVQAGTIEWIGIRSEKFAPITALDSIKVNTTQGIESDHYKGRSGKRQVTLIQQEHLAAIASYLGKEHIAPEELRRNILVRGINLQALIGQKVTIGKEVVLEITGHCHPCSRMEKNLGFGGYNAMRGHGGVTAKVLNDGIISKGDAISYQPDSE